MIILFLTFYSGSFFLLNSKTRKAVSSLILFALQKSLAKRIDNNNFKIIIHYNMNPILKLLYLQGCSVAISPKYHC